LIVGVKGKIIDLCKPTQRKFANAVEKVMGRNMEAIVVDNEPTALQCIEYMRSKRCGTATFIPLDTISVSPVAEKYRELRGARLALDVLQFDAVYERAIKYVVGNCLIADDWQICQDLCYSKGERVKIVALDGTVYHKGMITGGGVEKTSRWDAHQLGDLNVRKQQLLNQSREISEQKRKFRDDGELDAELNFIEAKITRLKQEELVLVGQIEDCVKEVEFMMTPIGNLEQDLEKTRGALDKLNHQRQAVVTSIREIETKIFGEFCDTHGFSNISEYEAISVGESKEMMSKRLEYISAKAKLENM
jgi:structural maintenance of chromosome 1